MNDAVRTPPPRGPRHWPAWVGIGIAALLARLPWSLQRVLGRGIGRLLMVLFGSRRRVAARNLALCFPELDADAQAALLRRSFEELGIGLFEFARAWWGSVEPMRGKVIDEDKRRISLGMKQCRANPWQEFAQNTKRGDRVKGPIKSITDFGVFVGLAAGIDGLVHLSDLSWNETGEAAVRNYKKGQEVEAIVLAVDVERERISLGIKQLDQDPFTTFVTVNDKGSIVTGKVKTVDARGAEIDLGEDIVGYLRASEISRDRVEDARNVLKEGDEVTAVVVNVDRKTRNIQLSIKQKDMADEQGAMANLSQQSSRESAGTTSLGALLRAKLDNSEK